MRVLALILCLLPLPAWGFQIRELSIDYRHYYSSVMAEMPGFEPHEGLALNLNTNVIGPVIWEARVHSTTDPGQYRLVGLVMRAGVRFGWVEGGWEHHSQHLLDARQPYIHFPHEDSAYLKLYLIGAP